MNLQPLKILHLASTVGKRSAGVGAVAVNLTRCQNDLGVDAQLWSVDGASDLHWASESFRVSADRLRGFPGLQSGIPAMSLPMEREARAEEQRGVSVVHQHGLWTGVSRVTNIMRRAHRTSTVVAPHGSLQSWALRKSRWKKKIALAWYENVNLRSCTCLHAVGANEVSDFRDYGLRSPVAVIPNGISQDWLESRGSAEAFRRQFGIHAEQRVVLFLSRVTPKKGLLMLLEAVKSIEREFADWQLVIAGPDEFNHRSEVERFVEQTGLAKHVRLVGPLFDQTKRDAFAAADLFVLPSFSEGAPVVILEALGCQVPVLTTKASPWQELETHGCGWWIDIGTGPLAEALTDALRRSPEELQTMGRRGKNLVCSEYSWTKSARMTIELYEWLLGRTGRPGFVVAD